MKIKNSNYVQGKGTECRPSQELNSSITKEEGMFLGETEGK